MASEIRTHCFTAHSCSGLCLKHETKNGVCNLQITSRNLFNMSTPDFVSFHASHLRLLDSIKCRGNIQARKSAEPHFLVLLCMALWFFISLPAPSFISVFLLTGPLVQFSPLPPRSGPSLSRWIALWNYKDGTTTFPTAGSSTGGRNINAVTSNKMPVALGSWVNR